MTSRAKPHSSSLATTALLLLVLAAQAGAGALITEETRLPARLGAGGGTVELEAVIVRPNDTARHPLAVINHGSPRDTSQRVKMTALRRLREAEEFARRGFATLVFMRRGFGTSGGSFAEGYGSSDHPDYAAAGLKAAEDIREAIRIMSEKPYVDGSRVVSVGQSAGGFATVALTASPPPGLVAAINFAGGRGSTAEDDVTRPDRLVAAFAGYGKTSRIPILFVYSENDHYFDPELARSFFDAFTAGGGNAEFTLAPEFGEDGHQLFSAKGIPVWTPYVDAFLAEHGLKLVSAPLPVNRPRPEPPEELSENGREAFEDYVNAAPHKAFVMTPRGKYSWRSGKRSVEEAMREALSSCAKDGATDCAVVNADDESR